MCRLLSLYRDQEGIFHYEHSQEDVCFSEAELRMFIMEYYAWLKSDASHLFWKHVFIPVTRTQSVLLESIVKDIIGVVCLPAIEITCTNEVKWKETLRKHLASDYVRRSGLCKDAAEWANSNNSFSGDPIWRLSALAMHTMEEH